MRAKMIRFNEIIYASIFIALFNFSGIFSMELEPKSTTQDQSIILQSKDGQRITIDRGLALLSPTIKNVVDDLKFFADQFPQKDQINNDPITLPLSVEHGRTLEKIKVFLSGVQKVRLNTQDSNLVKKAMISDIRRLTGGFLIELLTASVYLDIPELTKLLLPAVAEYFVKSDNLTEVAINLFAVNNPDLKKLLKETLVRNLDYYFFDIFKTHAQKIDLISNFELFEIAFDLNATRVVARPYEPCDCIHVWNASQPSDTIESKKIMSDSEVDIVEISRDGQYALSSHKSGTIVLSGLSQNEPQTILTTEIGFFEAIALSTLTTSTSSRRALMAVIFGK